MKLTKTAPTVLTAIALGLLPWAATLAATLPEQALAQHWSTAWVGLDLLMAAGAGATAYLLKRNDPRAGLTAAATAAVAIVDAWFDVLTASPGPDLTLAIASAVFAELPLAGFCVHLALRQHPTAQTRTPTVTYREARAA